MRLRLPNFSGLLLIALMLGGLLVTGLGVREILNSRQFLAKTSTTDGVVVEVDKVVEDRWVGVGDRSRYERVTFYYPVVQFVTASEQVVQYRDHVGSNPPAYRVGDSVRVLYDPANPQDARLDTFESRWFDAALPIFFGAVMLCISVAGLFFGESRRERRGRRTHAPVRGRRRRPRPSPP